MTNPFFIPTIQYSFEQPERPFQGCSAVFQALASVGMGAYNQGRQLDPDLVLALWDQGQWAGFQPQEVDPSTGKNALLAIVHQRLSHEHHVHIGQGEDAHVDENPPTSHLSGDRTWYSPRMAATQRLVVRLIEQGVDPWQPDYAGHDGWEALVALGWPDALRAALKHPHAPNDWAGLEARRWTMPTVNSAPHGQEVVLPMLHLCAWYGFGQALKALLEAGANPNAQDEQGQTPLMRCRHALTAQHLLAHGADPSLKDDAGVGVREGWSRRGAPMISTAQLQKMRTLFSAAPQERIQEFYAAVPLGNKGNLEKLWRTAPKPLPPLTIEGRHYGPAGVFGRAYLFEKAPFKEAAAFWLKDLTDVAVWAHEEGLTEQEWTQWTWAGREGSQPAQSPVAMTRPLHNLQWFAQQPSPQEPRRLGTAIANQLWQKAKLTRLDALDDMDQWCQTLEAWPSGHSEWASAYQQCVDHWERRCAQDGLPPPIGVRLAPLVAAQGLDWRFASLGPNPANPMVKIVQRLQAQDWGEPGQASPADLARVHRVLEAWAPQHQLLQTTPANPHAKALLEQLMHVESWHSAAHIHQGLLIQQEAETLAVSPSRRRPRL